jgi:hypothetical protein
LKSSSRPLRIGSLAATTSWRSSQMGPIRRNILRRADVAHALRAM